MTTQLLKGNWNTLKGALKQKYAQLTDDDLKYVEGKEEENWERFRKLGVTQVVLEDHRRTCSRAKTRHQ
jgi:hypothetical protein